MHSDVLRRVGASIARKVRTEDDEAQNKEGRRSVGQRWPVCERQSMCVARRVRKVGVTERGEDGRGSVQGVGGARNEQEGF